MSSNPHPKLLSMQTRVCMTKSKSGLKRPRSWQYCFQAGDAGFKNAERASKPLKANDVDRKLKLETNLLSRLLPSPGPPAVGGVGMGRHRRPAKTPRQRDVIRAGHVPPPLALLPTGDARLGGGPRAPPMAPGADAAARAEVPEDHTTRSHAGRCQCLLTGCKTSHVPALRLLGSQHAEEILACCRKRRLV